MNSNLQTPEGRWLAAMAGELDYRQHTTDPDVQLAALLRQGVLDLDPTPPPPLDEASVRRVMNTLQAQGAFEPQRRPVAAAAGQGHRGAVPAGGVAAAGAVAALQVLWGRWSVAATFVVAVLATLWLVNLSGPAPEDLPHHIKAPTAVPSQVVSSAQPDADATRLVSVLAAQGLTAEVRPDGDDRVVRAVVPAAEAGRYANALAEEGLSMPANGRLVVRFRASR